MPLPNLLPAGAKPRGSDFNALRAQLEAQRITGVAGLIGGAFSGGSALAALGLPPVIRRASNPRTFYCSVITGTDILVSAGVLNNVVYAGGTLSSASNGDLVYIEATVTTDTDTVTAVTVAKAASVPADTSTKAYTVIASVAVSGGAASVTPLAWNYSQLQKCGSFRWGGFGA